MSSSFRRTEAYAVVSDLVASARRNQGRGLRVWKYTYKEPARVRLDYMNESDHKKPFTEGCGHVRDVVYVSLVEEGYRKCLRNQILSEEAYVWLHPGKRNRTCARCDAVYQQILRYFVYWETNLLKKESRIPMLEGCLFQEPHLRMVADWVEGQLGQAIKFKKKAWRTWTRPEVLPRSGGVKDTCVEGIASPVGCGTRAAV